MASRHGVCKVFLIYLGVMLSSCWSMSASAQERLYTLSNAFFNDGTQLTGSFNYNASNNTYGNFNFSSVAGSISGATYNTANAIISNQSPAKSFDVYLNDGSRYIELTFDNPLGSGVTQDNITTANTSSYECLNCAPYRTLVQGFVTGSAPEPATWFLLVLGFAVIGRQLRVQRRKQDVPSSQLV